MKIGPKYKIARRLGGAVFEKTQTAKFALAQQKRNPVRRGRGGTMSAFGVQLLEKQRVRFSYNLTEKVMRKYAKEAIVQNPSNTANALFEKLEGRIDSVILRAGFAPTRPAARQMVSHGHILVNGKKTTIPSYQVTQADKITIRPGSLTSGAFATLEERFADQTPPAWLSVDKAKKEVILKGAPSYNPADQAFSLSLAVQYYKR